MSKVMMDMDLKRANFCLNKVKEIDSSIKDKFKSYAQKLPSLITSNGLIMTLAFIKSKSERAYEELYDILDEWLTKEALIPWESEEEDLLERLTKQSTEIVILVTQEAMRLAEWLKRMVEAEL